jgi:hypothetical protein
MAVSFRYLIKSLKPENLALSVFIFPFIYSYLFHLGFYNYALSFIFFFLTLTYWINNYKANKPILYLFTGILLLCTFFSNILTFSFLGITIGCMIIYTEFESNASDGKQLALSCVKRLANLALCALPSLILSFIFLKNVTFSTSTQGYDSNELIKWINDVRPLIVYGYEKEVNYTGQIFHVILIILFLSLVLKQNKVILKDQFSNLKQAILWFPICLSLVLFFVLPNDSSAGMMSDRLCLLFFIYLTIITATRNLPINMRTLFYVIIIFIHFSVLKKHSTIIRDLHEDAAMINQSANHIEANKIILPVNLSDNWLEPHFSSYLGVDKPLVILENYETEVGWFPVRWNPNSPNILLGERNTLNGHTFHENKNTQTKRQVDYIFLYGNLSKMEEANMKELKEIIAAEFTLEYESENKFIQLYKKKS